MHYKPRKFSVKVQLKPNPIKVRNALLSAQTTLTLTCSDNTMGGHLKIKKVIVLLKISLVES